MRFHVDSYGSDSAGGWLVTGVMKVVVKISVEFSAGHPAVVRNLSGGGLTKRTAPTPIQRLNRAPEIRPAKAPCLVEIRVGIVFKLKLSE